MQKKSPFYVGWSEMVSPSTDKFLKKILALLCSAIILLVLLVALLQKPYNDFTFEFGKSTQVTGVYYDQPVPMLSIQPGILPDSLSSNILLVGYGKWGAGGIMEKMMEQHGDLVGRQITVLGSLIYGDGKTLLELTDQERSLVKVGSQNNELPQLSARIPTAVRGEILDSKCYFGVMKPGEGKVHKSCAIRCISGGIPPVFRYERTDTKQVQYYLLKDKNGRDISQKILPWVAEKINLTGESATFLDWQVLFVDWEQFLENQPVK